jgi:hypothetical protein
MKTSSLALPALFALATACERGGDPFVCPPVFIPAVRVTVVDSLAGNNLLAGSSLVLRNAAGAVIDSAMVPAFAESPPTTISLGGGNGTYSLTVNRFAYRPWTKTAIHVEPGDACGPRTVDVTARLVPVP